MTGSWDQSIKVWNMDQETSLVTYKEHTYCVYRCVPDAGASVLFCGEGFQVTLTCSMSARLFASQHNMGPHEQ